MFYLVFSHLTSPAYSGAHFSKPEMMAIHETFPILYRETLVVTEPGTVKHYVGFKCFGTTDDEITRFISHIESALDESSE